VDVAKGIAKHLGRDLEIITTEWDGILAGLLAGKYDAIIGSMAATKERAKKVDFSEPYYFSGAQLFVHKDYADKIKDIKDLYGDKVGVVLGETYEHYLRQNHKKVQVITYKGTPDIFQDMKNRRIKGFVTDRLVGLYQIRQADQPFINVGPMLYKEKIAIPVVKDNKKLLSQINKALTTMKENGEIDAIYSKWFGLKEQGDVKVRDGSMESSVIVSKLLKGFGISLLVAFLSILFGFILSIPLGIVLHRHTAWIYYFVRTFNDIIRGTPVLIQLFFVYFGAPQIGIILSPFQAAVFTLTINSSSYMSEVIRSGLMSVAPGQKSAAFALGLTGFQTFLYVIWPQAFRIALPTLMNSVVALIKDTALISIISVAEVIREAQSIISVTYNPIKYYLIVAMMFFVVTFPLMKFAGRLEKKIKEKGFANA